MSWSNCDISDLIVLPTNPDTMSRSSWGLHQVNIGTAPDVAHLSSTHLCPEEQQQLAGYHFPKRRHEWLAGRLAAKYAISNYRHQSLRPKDIVITSNAQGKPLALLPNQEKVHISISHSATKAVALAAIAPCGIDIQEITPALTRIKERFVWPQEEILLPQLAPDPLTALGLLWSAKEALRKTISLWPLLGLLENTLSAIAKEGNTCYLTLQSKPNHRPLPKYLPLVTVTMIDNMALAITISTNKPEPQLP